MESNQPSGANGIKDAIVTLPAWGIFLIGLLCISSLLTALWLLAFSKEDNLKGNAIQLLIVLIPLTSAVIAAIAIRRTSTRQNDLKAGPTLCREMVSLILFTLFLT